MLLSVESKFLGGCVIVLLFLCANCTPHRDYVVHKKSISAEKHVKLGDDIFEAYDSLKSAGFDVSYPEFTTVSKSIYTMHISYGVHHTTLEGLAYAYEVPLNGKSIRGFADANKKGEIYRLELR